MIEKIELPHISIDAERIAQGMYRMILEDKEGKPCLRLGMLPAKYVLCLKKLLKKRIPDQYLDRVKLETVNGKAAREMVINSICARILELSHADGITDGDLNVVGAL
jgi:hypothetical protein